VVEDQEIERELMTQYLHTSGHTVEVATDGKDGLRKFQDGNFDLVLTDRAMPEMSGEQLAAAIKPMSPNVRVIMVTGFGDMMNSTNEQPEGVDLVVSKPVGLEELRSAMAKVCSE